MDLALRHLAPLRRGLEIGASALNPFPGLAHWNLDHPSATLFQAAQERAAGRAAPVDVFGAGERLPLRSGALDYLLASHVLEHMPDTLRCLREWSRVVRPGGVLFLIVPHRERTFDRTRARTTLEHHLADYALGKTVASSPLVPSSHYHVWVTGDLVHLVEWLAERRWIDWDLVEVEDVDSKVGNGFTLVARVRSHPPEPPAGTEPQVEFCHWTRLYPFQVPGRTLEFVTRGAEARPPADLPRGRYRVVPIHGGFPPRAGAPDERDVGEEAPAAEIEDWAVEGSRLVLTGETLAPGGYLVAHLPDGRDEPVVPDSEPRRWVVELEGLTVPDEPFAVTPVNLPPGGGAGPRCPLRIPAG